jgi:hypothetical protein
MSKEHFFYPFVKNEKAVDYIDQLIKAIPNLKIKIEQPRRSKLGYMKQDKIRNIYTISINNNLSPSKFLYVFLHEYAHLMVAQKYKTYKSHGYEWQQAFFGLLSEAIQKTLFQPNIAQTIIKQYFHKGVYSRQRDFIISRSIDEADQVAPALYIKDLAVGTSFMLKNGMHFILLEKKRTRFLCSELKTNKKYLISSYAIVDKVIKKT